MIGVDVGLGVHAPLAVVHGGENRLFGSSFAAVVGGLSFGAFNLEVLNEKERVPLRVCAVFDKPQDDGFVFVGMFRPFDFRSGFAVGKIDVATDPIPVGFKVKC